MTHFDDVNKALEKEDEDKTKYPVGSRVRFELSDLYDYEADEGVVTRSDYGYVWVKRDSNGETLIFDYRSSRLHPITARKNADFIIAWAKGSEIEYRRLGSDEWYSCTSPLWEATDVEYRIKPTKPVDIIVDKFVAFMPSLDNAYNKPNVRYIFDAGTKVLKSVEMLDNNTWG